MCFLFSNLDQSDQVLFQEEDTSGNNSNSPRFTQLTSQTTGLNSEKNLISTKKSNLLVPQEGIEWTDYDDFPSSEDLSAFLADLELDALNNMTKERFQPIINSKNHA